MTHRRIALRGALAALLVSVSTACDEPRKTGATTSATPQQQRSEPSAVLRGEPLGSDKLPTTHHRIYVANLESRLEGVETLVRGAAEPSPKLHMELAELYRSRLAYRGDLTDLSRAVHQAELALKAEPENPRFLVVAAGLALLGHRFEQARAMLDRAAAAGASDEEMARIERELHWAAGRAEEAIDSIRAAAQSNPTVHSLARLAVLERQLGDKEASELAFERAEDRIRDTNPYTVAWLHFLRGRALLDDGEIDRAVVFLRESVRRLPEYTEAQLHLAEALLVQDEQSPEAVAIYEDMAARGNAEAMAMLSSLTESPEADKWRAAADEAYATLLREHPAVSASHAADFFAAHGDHERALELLTRNAELQPNGESFTRLAEAQLAAGRPEDAARSAELAVRAEYTPDALPELCKRICAAQSPEEGDCKLSCVVER